MATKLVEYSVPTVPPGRVADVVIDSGVVTLLIAIVKVRLTLAGVGTVLSLTVRSKLTVPDVVGVPEDRKSVV